jgi:hypothetical protein
MAFVKDPEVYVEREAFGMWSLALVFGYLLKKI